MSWVILTLLRYGLSAVWNVPSQYVCDRFKVCPSDTMLTKCSSTPARKHVLKTAVVVFYRQSNTLCPFTSISTPHKSTGSIVYQHNQLQQLLSGIRGM
jgi:hypothetical protein